MSSTTIALFPCWAAGAALVIFLAIPAAASLVDAATSTVTELSNAATDALSVVDSSSTTSGVLGIALTYAKLLTEFIRLSLHSIPVVGPAVAEEKRFYQYLSMSWMLMLPTVVALLTHFQGQINEWSRKKIAKLRNEHIRDIVFTQSSDYYFNLRSDNRNQILQKAIFLHLGRRKDAGYVDGQFRLMQNDEGEESWEQRVGEVGSRSAADLKRFTVNTVPQMAQWTKIEPGLQMSHWQENVDGAIGETRTKHTISLKCCAKEGDLVIDAFVQKCYKEYIDKLKAEEDKARYLYQMQLGIKPKGDDEGGSSSGSAPPVFKKYKLSEDKTFESLFFPEKKDILALVDDFQNNRGKFAIEGFPKKLGLLLYGPPGTGKTTLVKALASYTRRHIVSVPLSKITTNQQLYDIMFERVFPCLGDDGVAQQLGFDEIIFLMEDVDAATDIVKTRKTGEKQKSTIAVEQSRVFEANCKEEDDDKEAEGAAGNVVASAAAFTKEVSFAGATLESAGRAASVAGFDLLTDLAGPLKADASLYEPADKLDLAGLLNVLDGVVDSPGRMVVMTTNHPERLDQALIRPGRVNKKLLMTYIDEPRMVEMLSHHYGGQLSKTQCERLSSALRAKRDEFDGEFNITPAEVEQLCAEHDSFDDFMGGLAHFGSAEGFDMANY